MRVIGVVGYQNSGKTTVCRALIEALTRLGYSVGSVKYMHHPFTADREDTDTWLHARAGADTVVALGPGQTHIIHSRAISWTEIWACFTQDIVVVEGAPEEMKLPVIVCVGREGDYPRREHAVAYSGIGMPPDDALPALDAWACPGELADFVLAHAREV